MKKLLFSLSIGLLAFTLNAQSLKINDPFFSHVGYIGAFDGTNDWTAGWANWTPEDTEYPEPTITKGNGNEDLSTSLHITANETWSGVIKLDGWVYVDEPAVLTISPGTIIRGEAKSALIIQRGAKINAEGTSTNPIVFTSGQGAGFRANSDWAGVIICGKGINNMAGGIGLTEGGTGVNHGGTDNTDNSGIIKYVRIEFPGYMVSEGNEINGLSMGSVGSGTTIDYVQVSNSGDDGFEFWGGAVNAKHLISYRTEDDDFDTDNGYIGMVQFGLIARDFNIVDTDAANGFESDNDPSGSNATPRTNPTFSNISAFGPSATSTNPETLLPNHASGNAMRIRRGSALQVYNSVLAGWANGLLIESSNGWAAAQTDSLTVQNTNIAGVRTSWFKAGSGLVVADIESWFNATDRHNDTTLLSASLKITDPFNYGARNFQPMAGSPVFKASIWYKEPVVYAWSEYAVSKVIDAPNVASETDFKVDVKVRYDADSIYMIFDVVDDIIVNSGGDVYKLDNIEVYLDMTNSKNPLWPRRAGWPNSSFLDGDYQFRLVPEKAFSDNNSLKGVNQVYTSVAGGYQFALSIVLDSLLMDFVATEGKQIGFDVLASDNDNNPFYRDQLSWNSSSDMLWNDPSYWGTIELAANGIFTTVADVEAPTAPANVVATATINDVVITWDASTDNIVVENYIILQGTTVLDTIVAKQTANTFSVNDLAEGTYTFSVKAMDMYGHKSAETASNSVTIVISGVEKSSVFASFSPNPVVDILTIRSSELIRNVTIYNVTGKMVSENNVNSTSSQISFTEFKSGLYFVKVKTANETSIQKILKK